MRVNPARATRLLLLAAAVSAGAAASAYTSQPAEPRVIEITARRFAFEPPEVVVNVGERITLSVRSADGVHGIEIKKLDVKKEIPRGGEAVLIEFTATAAGKFPIVCSEYCGKGHEDMKGALVVVAREDAAQ